MADKFVVSDSAKQIVEDLNREKNQITATIESLESRLTGLQKKVAEIDSTIAILVDTYKLKTSRPIETEAATDIAAPAPPPPVTRGRRKAADAAKSTDTKKRKPVEIKTAVRDYIAANLDFQVKSLVAAVRAVRPDAQQPSIQAELTKLRSAGELERVGYGQYRSKTYVGAPDETAASALESDGGPALDGAASATADGESEADA